MAVRKLADDKIKFTICTTKPANPAAPTVAELNGGIDASMYVSKDGWKWSAQASESVDEPPLGSATKAAVPGMGNYDLGFKVWRQFLAAGGFDPVADVVFEAVKIKGSQLWGYVRKTDKAAIEPWAAGDEIYLGAEFITDTPQSSQTTGYIAYEIPCMAQAGHDFIEAAA